MNKGIVMILGLLMATSAQAYGGGDVAAGEAKAVVCAACHGPAGASQNPDWPVLAGQGQKYLEKQLRDFQTGARPNLIMKPQAGLLNEQDIQNIAAYYAAQKAPVRSTQGVGEAPEETLKLGEALYRGGHMERGIPACAACHGASGQGIPPAAFPALAGQHAKYTRLQLQAFKNAAGIEDLASDANLNAIVQRPNDPNGMMRDIAAKLTEKEIEALALYIQGLY